MLVQEVSSLKRPHAIARSCFPALTEAPRWGKMEHVKRMSKHLKYSPSRRRWNLDATSFGPTLKLVVALLAARGVCAADDLRDRSVRLRAALRRRFALWRNARRRNGEGNRPADQPDAAQFR